MDLQLKPYRSIEEHKDVFDHNYSIVDKIGYYAEISEYVRMLVSMTGIAEDLVLIALKKYIMFFQEYNSGFLKINFRLLLSPIQFVLSLMKKIIFYKNRVDRAETDVIVDDWYDGSPDTFYGQEFIGGLKLFKSPLIAKYSDIHFIQMNHLLKYFPCFFRAFLCTLKLNRLFKINFSNFNYAFFIEFLKGYSVGEKLKPKVIVSGNDNGFRMVQGKASGAELVLIQNGNRPYWGDSAFMFADHYVSLWGKNFEAFSKRMGCYFKKMSFFGSLRVYNYSHDREKIKNEFDILYISDWEPDYPDLCQYGGNFASSKEEIRTIELISEFARGSKLKIAYRCRGVNEIEKLKEKNLYVETVQYYKFGESSIYDLMQKADLVLSSCSTAVWEALGMGKKGGFVYLSENPYVTLFAKGLNIVYDLDAKISLAEFIDHLRNEKKDTEKYAIQNPNYVKDLLQILKKTVNYDI